VAQAFMSSPEALKSQLSNMAERGSVTKKRAEELMHLAGSIENTGKMRRLLELADTLKAERPRDWRMVVFTTRKATQEAIGKAFRTRDVPVAYIRGGAAEENREAVQDFWAEEPGANVLISTDAGAEGLNLQVANVLVNYDLPWNPMLVEQRIGRIQRLSSRHANVLIFNLVTRGTVEERIVGRLMEKLQAVSSSLGDVEGILESFSAKDELGLEKEIRELVLESMQGIDVEARVRKLQESIDEAKALYEQEQAEVERHLGTMLEMEQEGPLPPELSETTPRKGVQGFATGALIADGGALTPDGTGGWTLEREDEPVQRVRFKAGSAIGDERGVQAERGTLVFREGRPDFERLVDEWCARDAHRVHDLRSVKAPIKNIVSEWVAEQAPGAELLHVERLEESSAFQGSLAVRAGAEVAHDRYEKLMEVVVRPEGHGVLSPELFVEAPEQEDWEDDETRDQMAIQGDERSPLNAPPSSLPERITRKLKPGDLMPDLEQQLQHALAVDADVVAFCDYQFTRMAEELTRTDGKKTLEKHVRGQFVPRVSGEVVGMVGSVYSVIELNVTFRETNGREQKLKIQLAPALSAVVGSPDRVRSSTTGAWVRRERAIATRTGDDWVEEENAVACAWTGDRLHPEQVRPCRLTGLMVDEALLSDAEILDPLLDLSVHTLPESCDEMLLTDLHERAQQIGLPVLRKARRAWRAKAPIAGTQAVIAEVPKLLGMGTRRLAFVMAEGHLVGQTGSL